MVGWIGRLIKMGSTKFKGIKINFAAQKITIKLFTSEGVLWTFSIQKNESFNAVI
jgi:hypothetical protein